MHDESNKRTKKKINEEKRDKRKTKVKRVKYRKKGKDGRKRIRGGCKNGVRARLRDLSNVYLRDSMRKRPAGSHGSLVAYLSLNGEE